MANPKEPTIKDVLHKLSDLEDRVEILEALELDDVDERVTALEPEDDNEKIGEAELKKQIEFEASLFKKVATNKHQSG